MKIREIMSRTVVRIHPEESVTVAARALEHYNIGALPICGSDGRLRGMVTDRDLVTRCLASGKNPDNTPVKDVMTKRLYVARPDMDVDAVAMIMGREQIRRLPVMESGKLLGMVSLGDLAQTEQTVTKAGDALADISNNLSVKD